MGRQPFEEAAGRLARRAHFLGGHGVRRTRKPSDKMPTDRLCRAKKFKGFCIVLQ